MDILKSVFQQLDVTNDGHWYITTKYMDIHVIYPRYLLIMQMLYIIGAGHGRTRNEESCRKYRKN